MREDDYGAWPKTEQELTDYIRSLIDQQHTYETSAEAMAKAAVAAFNYIGSTLGTTGFQASWAELQFLKVTRGLRGPFAIIDGEQLLYPQYDIRAKVEEYIREWRPQLAPLAKERLAEEQGNGLASPHVVARWREIAALADD